MTQSEGGVPVASTKPAQKHDRKSREKTNNVGEKEKKNRGLKRSLGEGLRATETLQRRLP